MMRKEPFGGRLLKATHLVLRAGVLAVFFSCSSGGEDIPLESEPSETPNTPPPLPMILPQDSVLSCPKGTNLSYRNFGRHFFTNHCTECHSSNLTGEERKGSPKDSNFDTGQNIQLYRGSILTRLLGTGPKMPPGVDLMPLDKQMVIEWIQCGAPLALN